MDVRTDSENTNTSSDNFGVGIGLGFLYMIVYSSVLLPLLNFIIRFFWKSEMSNFLLNGDLTTIIPYSLILLLLYLGLGAGTIFFLKRNFTKNRFTLGFILGAIVIPLVSIILLVLLVFGACSLLFQGF